MFLSQGKPTLRKCLGNSALCPFPPQTLPELCSHQDQLDFLMEALIIRCIWGQGPGEGVGEAPRTACRNSLSSPWG